MGEGKPGQKGSGSKKEKWKLQGKRKASNM